MKLLLHSNDMAELTQPLDVHVHFVEELIQLAVEWDAEIIINLHYTGDLSNMLG